MWWKKIHILYQKNIEIKTKNATAEDVGPTETRMVSKSESGGVAEVLPQVVEDLLGAALQDVVLRPVGPPRACVWVGVCV